jgi:hypothetical protein
MQFSHQKLKPNPSLEIVEGFDIETCRPGSFEKGSLIALTRPRPSQTRA